MKARFFGAMLLLASAGSSAYGVSLTFSFDGLSKTGGTTLTGGSTNTQIQTWMTAYLQNNGCTGCTVTVGSGAVADYGIGYNGDNHTVGPVNGTTVTSATLGNTEHATYATLPATGTLTTNDVYLRNIGGTSSPNDRITMIFTGLTISSVNFDYELFPQASGTPDFSLYAGTNSGNLSLDPLIGATKTGTVPASPFDTHSPDSGYKGTEKSAQAIGVWGDTALSNVTDLSFVDWPNTIGIDNLSITYTKTGGAPPAVPEPGSFLLLGTVMSGLFLLQKRMRKA